MICPRCGANHPRGCRQHVEALMARIAELEAVTKECNVTQSIQPASNVTCADCSRRIEQTRLRVSKFRANNAKV